MFSLTVSEIARDNRRRLGTGGLADRGAFRCRNREHREFGCFAVGAEGTQHEAELGGAAEP